MRSPLTWLGAPGRWLKAAGRRVGSAVPVLRRRPGVAAGVVVVVILAVVLPFALSGGATSSGNTVVILAKVEARTLQSTVQLTGTLARKNIRNVTAAGQGLVTDVESTDGVTTDAGQVMFALNGRDAIAEPGTTPFFRTLEPGDTGDDVLQLKQILNAAGDYPGSLTDNQFTEQTQFALAQWQAQHHYPNTTPATTQAVNVALEQGSGYQLGPQSSTGLTIGPPSDTATGAAFSRPSGPGTVPSANTATLASFPHDLSPTVTIQSVSDQVSQGQPADFVVSMSATSVSAVTVNLTYGGSADSSVVITPPSTLTIPAGATSGALEVDTRSSTAVGATTTLVVTVASGTGYTVGSPASAQTDIANPNVPKLQISGGTTVSPGGSATLTVTADQAPLHDTQVLVSLAGSAAPGTDYTPPDPVLTLPAGSTSTTLTVATLPSDTIGANKYLVVSLSPSPGSYTIGSAGSTVITIGENAGPPVVTLTSAAAVVTKGQPYTVTVSLNAPVSSPLTVNLSYGGDAVAGTDYTAPGSPVVVAPGQTSLPVTIPTVASDAVQPDRTLVVSLASGSDYTVGSPSSASVTIKSTVLPMLDISADPTAIGEGGAATFTITADQPPTKDTSVNFAVEGTAQPGQDYQPLVGVALLKAGQTQVTVTFQSIQKNVSFEPTDMIVGDWPIRVGAVYVKTGDPVTPGEPILQLTEPTVSVTLQASAADRTNLQVGQSCTVQISGDQSQVQGTITELDATPTVVGGGGGAGAAGAAATGSSGGGGTQVYEGRIDSADLESLHGADGSTVSIKVVDDQVTDAPTVPIAAVKQNGVGTDVVRVVGPGNQLSEVPVVTGLSEGSYIEIKSGLSIGQTIVVQSDQS